MRRVPARICVGRPRPQADGAAPPHIYGFPAQSAGSQMGRVIWDSALLPICFVGGTADKAQIVPNHATERGFQPPPWGWPGPPLSAFGARMRAPKADTHTSVLSRRSAVKADNAGAYVWGSTGLHGNPVVPPTDRQLFRAVRWAAQRVRAVQPNGLRGRGRPLKPVK
jgi:hypothetical protein